MCILCSFLWLDAWTNQYGSTVQWEHSLLHHCGGWHLWVIAVALGDIWAVKSGRSVWLRDFPRKLGDHLIGQFGCQFGCSTMSPWLVPDWSQIGARLVRIGPSGWSVFGTVDVIGTCEKWLLNFSERLRGQRLLTALKVENSLDSEMRYSN